MTKKLTTIELFAASSWLAGVSLQELAGSKKVSMKTFLKCHRIYTMLDAMTHEGIQLVDLRKENK